MELRKGNLHIVEIKRNSKIMEDRPYLTLDASIMCKNSSDNKTTFGLLALKQ